MKCYECKFSKKSRSKDHMYWCQRYKVHGTDNYSGCFEGIAKTDKEVNNNESSDR